MLVVYANPARTVSPVPPYGAERIAHAFVLSGCTVRLCAPWLDPRPLHTLDRELAAGPALVAVSLRNVDDALVVRGVDGRGAIDTEWYLPAVARAIERVKARGVPVVLGGAAVAAMPGELAAYFGVEHVVAGPGEDLAFRIGRGLVEGRGLVVPDDPRVWRPGAAPARGRADAWQAPPGPTPRMGEYLALARAKGGRVPVTIATGCDRRCSFCVEPTFYGWRVRPRPVDEIVHELTLLRRAGVRRIWLAASELNVPDTRHAVAVLRAIAAARLDVEVTGFVQPAPVDDVFLDALVEAGVDPASLSWELGHLDESLLRRGAGPANLPQIERLVEHAVARGWRTLGGSVLFGAHPHEDEGSLARAVARAQAFDRALPDGFGLAYATGGRVYPGTPLAAWVRAHADEARPHLYGRWREDLLAPVVFCRPGPPRLLLARVQEALRGHRGCAQVLNGEAAATQRQLRAEAWVDRALIRAWREDGRGAVRAASAALRIDPGHRGALRARALASSNLLGDGEAARRDLQALLAQASPAEAAELRAALGVLGGAGVGPA